MNATLIWFIAAAAFFLIELLTPGFLLACFGIGCLFACIPALLGGGLLVQSLFFAAGSLLALFLLRPLVNKNKKNKLHPTGIEALKGRVGKVTRAIDGDKKEGRVAVDGDEWLAVAAETNDYIEAGSRVEIIGHNSIVLVVRALKE